MKEELKKKMIAVMGSCAIHTTEWIAEKCAQVAIDHYKERDQALSMSGVIESDESKVAEYWFQRSKRAEAYIKECSCDPDITENQLKAWREYQDFIND